MGNHPKVFEKNYKSVCICTVRGVGVDNSPHPTRFNEMPILAFKGTKKNILCMGAIVRWDGQVWAANQPVAVCVD